VRLDPRIYPAWWGEEDLAGDSPSRGYKAQNAPDLKNVKNQAKPESIPGHMKRPETSLERGMREIKETAMNLDKNFQFFRSNKQGEDREIPNTQGQDYFSSCHETKNTQPPRDHDPISGFGSSFRPISTQQNIRKVDAFDH